MADKKISQLNAASTLGNSDVFPLVQNNETKKVSYQVLKEQVNNDFKITEKTTDVHLASDGNTIWMFGDEEETALTYTQVRQIVENPTNNVYLTNGNYSFHNKYKYDPVISQQEESAIGFIGSTQLDGEVYSYRIVINESNEVKSDEIQLAKKSDLTSKADKTEVTTLSTQVDTNKTNIATNTANIAHNKHSIAYTEERLQNVIHSLNGVAYREITDASEAYTKDVAKNSTSGVVYTSGVEKWADLEKLGGKSVVVDGEVIHADVDQVVSVGKNLFDGTQEINTSAYSKTINSGDLFNFIKAMPIGTYTMSWNYTSDGINGAKNQIRIYKNSENLKTINNGVSFELTESVQDVTHFVAYFGQSCKNGTMKNFQIEKGSTATDYSQYFKHETTIPTAITSLEGYGQSNGDKVNVVDFTNKIYHKQGSYVNGAWVDDVRDIDISSYIDDDFQLLEVEGGGTITFHQPNDKQIPVPSTIVYDVDISQFGGNA